MRGRYHLVGEALYQQAHLLKIERIIPNPTKIITIIESIEEYIYYFKVFDDTSKMFCAEYSKEMSITDIVEVNSSYFKEFKKLGINTITGIYTPKMSNKLQNTKLLNIIENL